MASFSKNQVITNFSWRYIGKLGTQVVSFLVTIILARLIAPEAFGAVAIVGIFTSLLQVFVDSGLGSALIQKEDADEIDFASVFYFNIIVCIVLYLILYVSAPWVARFYDDPLLSPLLRVASLSLIITGLRSTQETFVTRHLLFRKHFWATTIASLLSLVIAVIMAYLGFEAWAIVAQQLLNTGICTVLLWFLIPWRPSSNFSLQRLKGLISYGWKVLGAQLIDTFYSEARSLLIGKVYTAKDLAYYNQGKTFPYMIVSGLNSALNSVLFPVMSRSQDDNSALKAILRKTIRVSMFFISSVLSYIICCADSMVEVLMTEKWLHCVIYMQILCLDSLFWPLITAHYNSYKAIGRSGIYFSVVTITKVVGIILLIASIPFGIVWVAISSVVSMMFQATMVAIISRKVSDYLYKEQIQDFLKALTPAILIFICSWWVHWLPLSAFYIFVIQTFIAGVVFFTYGLVAKCESFELVRELINKRFIRKDNNGQW